MDPDMFSATLSREGFAAPVAARREPGSMAEHTHPFEAKALIVAGELTLRVAGVDTVYRPGEVFHLLPDTPHTEFYGPDGVDYLVGRR